MASTTIFINTSLTDQSLTGFFLLLFNFNFYDLPAIVIAANQTNLMRCFKLLALRASSKAGSFDLPMCPAFPAALR
jgi:hypothetical protein